MAVGRGTEIPEAQNFEPGAARYRDVLTPSTGDRPGYMMAHPEGMVLHEERPMKLTDKDRAFLEAHHAAAMITLRADGTPHAVRVGVALVDGMLWSSGTHDRVRTGHLRRDPRCTLFVFDPTRRYLTLEAIVTILEGPDAPRQIFRLVSA